MTVSLIIATYNWPRALYLCLDSVMRQTLMPTEILIADDGSGPDTLAVVNHFKQVSPVPVRHIWHEDAGFRLAAIRNKAIAASTGEYVIQVDGDVILHRKFIRDHVNFARPGYFVTGSRGIISESLTQRLLNGEVASVSALSRGMGSRNNVLRNLFLASFYRALNPSRPPRGCNMAFWRSDLIRINGYDEDFNGWGYEDVELYARLRNCGIKRNCLKFCSVVYHLYHRLAERTSVDDNRQRYLQTLEEHRTRCQNGVDRYLPGAESSL